MKRDWLQILTNLGVIVGLIVLVYQIRQTDQHALANIVESSYHLASANLNSLRGENPSAVLAKALTDPEKLTVEDRIVLNAHHLQILYEADLYWNMARLGIYENMAWQGIAKSLSTNLAYPKGRDWWAENRYRVDPAIRVIFDEGINDNPNLQLERYTQ